MTNEDKNAAQDTEQQVTEEKIKKKQTLFSSDDTPKDGDAVCVSTFRRHGQVFKTGKVLRYEDVEEIKHLRDLGLVTKYKKPVTKLDHTIKTLKKGKHLIAQGNIRFNGITYKKDDVIPIDQSSRDIIDRLIFIGQAREIEL